MRSRPRETPRFIEHVFIKRSEEVVSLCCFISDKFSPIPHIDIYFITILV
jgi:hypothetical protein